jgi:hypothetical protein
MCSATRKANSCETKEAVIMLEREDQGRRDSSPRNSFTNKNTNIMKEMPSDSSNTDAFANKLSQSLRKCSIRHHPQAGVLTPIDRLHRTAQGRTSQHSQYDSDNFTGELEYFRFRIPEEAEFLACFCSEILHARALEAPLAQFYSETAKTLDIDALALTVWSEHQAPYDFSIYVLGDYRWKYDPDSVPPDKLQRLRNDYIRFGDAFSEVDWATRERASHLSCSLWYMNTHGKAIEEILPDLNEKLTTEDRFGLHSKSAELVFTACAEVFRNGS